VPFGELRINKIVEDCRVGLARPRNDENPAHSTTSTTLSINALRVTEYAIRKNESRTVEQLPLLTKETSRKVARLAPEEGDDINNIYQNSYSLNSTYSLSGVYSATKIFFVTILINRSA
jgi:hypothetical protein